MLGTVYKRCGVRVTLIIKKIYNPKRGFCMVITIPQRKLEYTPKFQERLSN